MPASRRSWTLLVLSAALPVAAAAAWIPLRQTLPNTDLALALVVLLAGIGGAAGRAAVLCASLAAGIAFDILDTRPYGTLTMSRGTDVLTALVLVGTGVLVGSGAARLARYRRSEDRRAGALALVMEASGLVATGQESPLITEVLATEIGRELGLARCVFHPAPPAGTHPTVARDGRLVGLLSGGPDEGAGRIDLPVWSQGEVVGHYMLMLAAGAPAPSRQDLRVALSLADQAGAAMVGAPEPEPEPDPDPGPRRPGGPPRRLRLVGARERPEPVVAGEVPKGVAPPPSGGPVVRAV